MSSMWTKARRRAAAVFSPKPGRPGMPSAVSPTRASQSGMLVGQDAPLLQKRVLVDDPATHAVDLHDALPANGLSEILVGREDPHLLDVDRKRRGRRRERIVGLVAIHRPDDDPESARGVLRRGRTERGARPAPPRPSCSRRTTRFAPSGSGCRRRWRGASPSPARPRGAPASRRRPRPWPWQPAHPASCGRAASRSERERARKSRQ